MYREAEPSVDFDKLIKIGDTTKEEWFMKYYLNEDEQSEIIDYHLNKHKCDEWERNKIKVSIQLGSAPSYVKKGS